METTMLYKGYIRVEGYRGYIGDYIGMMEKKMETTVLAWGLLSIFAMTITLNPKP